MAVRIEIGSKINDARAAVRKQNLSDFPPMLPVINKILFKTKVNLKLYKK